MKSEGLTNRQLRELSHSYYRGSWALGIALFFYNTIIVALILASIRVFVILTKERKPPFDAIYEYVPTKTREAAFALVTAAAVLIIYIPARYMLRRYYIGIISDKEMWATRRYFGANLSQTKKVAIAGFLVTAMLKVITLVPAVMSAYLVYRCAFVSRLENLNTVILIGFMLSLGFTIVWLGFWIKYCISLCLTPYILTLSPKTNPFDACDLSIRLMDSKHMRYISFWVYNLRFLLPCILWFPSCVCIPMVRISYTLFIKDILGTYWQDKYPLMIERWKRRALQL